MCLRDYLTAKEVPHRSRQQYLEQQALQAAQKAIRCSGRQHMDVDDMAMLRIQTVQPWHRVMLGILGLVMLVGGIVSIDSESLWLALPLIGFGVALIVVAIIGRKRTVQSVLDAIDMASILEILT